MSKICTSLEQSKKLIELGIDVSTADMDYIPFANEPKEYNCVINIYNNEHEDDWIPAWSASALLDLLPPYLFEFERGIDLNIYPNISCKSWHCSYMPNAVENMKTDKFKQMTNGDDLIDAAFEMICWLKENKLI